tara:strand:- start:6194 stop:7387 length:1194 start_codon:yes stop_codon:yes gene_type:complete
MRFKFLVFLVFLLFAGCDLFQSQKSSTGLPDSETVADHSEFLDKDEPRIFFTKDIKGFIDICGCSEDMAGGLPRIASLKKKYQNSIWVDLGNWDHDESHKDPVPEVTAEIMHSFFDQHVEYDIIVDKFLHTGNNDLQSVILGFDDNENQARFTYVPKDNSFCLDVENFKDPKGYLESSENVHILISDCSIESNQMIAEYISESNNLNMYLIGHSEEDRGVFSDIWSPPILPFGQEVGSLVLPSMDFERIYMSSKWVDDNSVVEMIASIREKGFIDKVPVDKEESLNSEFCMNCHQDSYDIWKDTKHAHAWETLVDRDVTLRPDCVGCHVTNWNHEDLSYSYVNVGCVACHQGNPIQHSIKPSKNKLVASFETCSSCHRPDHSTLFSIKGYWPQIQHP